MDDYIKRSDAIKTVCGDCEYYSTNDCEDCRLDRLTKIPPADVRPVIPARWIALDIYRSEGNYKCSNCGQPCYVPECMGEPMYSVCPNCGAMMGDVNRGTD